MQGRQLPPSSARTDVPEAVRVQILATEHWSLLATRNITYSAIFSRTSIFLTVVSAAVVALALVAQATEFGDRFYVFALLVLPVALFIGLATFVRLIDARIEDFWLVSGMNRLRHAYLEIAPELEPYFVTGHHDDRQGLYETYGPRTEVRLYPPALWHVDARGGDRRRSRRSRRGPHRKVRRRRIRAEPCQLAAVVTSVIVVLLVYASRRIIERGRRLLEPRFAR